MAQAYLYLDLDQADRREALAILTSFLDDRSPLVRRAIAEVFAGSPKAPHHIVLALAEDQGSIATIVLAASPVLSDAELIDCAATAGEAAQMAIASRQRLSVAVAAAIAETGSIAALVTLAANFTASLPSFSIHRMIERHGETAELREALLRREDLPSAARVDLVAATMRALGAFVSERNWMSNERVERVGREAKDRAAIVIAEASKNWRHALDLAAHLRKSGQLTVGFAFRSILSGRVDLFKAALSELSGTPIGRVDGLTDHCDCTGFGAVYRRAGLPLDLLPAFRLALGAARDGNWKGRPAGLSRAVIERVLVACEAINAGHLDKLLVLLRRFEAEAARDEVRTSPVADPTMQVSIAEPLVLTDLHADAQARVPLRARQRIAPRREPQLTIDMSALEAELRAA